MPNHVKRHLKSLFKLFTNKRRKDSTDESIQKWRDLSPSRPPLPFLPPESLHLDNDTSCSDTSEANSTEV